MVRSISTRREDQLGEEGNKNMGGRSSVSEKMILLVALLILQLCFAGFHIVSRVALNIGISKVVYPVYRNIIALLMLGPFSYFFEKKERPPLTFSLLVQFFLLALVGITANQGFYILGLYYASPTFASAMQNLVPAITFILASTFGCEQVNIRRKDGLAKILGTIASVGELDLGLYISTWSLLILVWLDGPAGSDSEEIPGQTLTHLIYGVISSGIVIALQTWCIQKGGPVFVASFQPVQTVLVASMAFVILGDQLYSGGVIGAALIMVGLYLVLWGKTEERRNQNQDKEETLTKHLLEGKSNDEESYDESEIP
ncbi:nodulin MtN21 /EamA-like transporter family protein [Forsythia ovata]|uniref:WAT1-related protein n=1 Tax=Forsythia ovata TaxID=205694 RepID=A0ABD1QSP0_9LAMI